MALGISYLRAGVKRCLPARLLTALRLWKNRKKENRRLEIGPGEHPLPGFEALDARPGPFVDYVLNAAKPLPFRNATFSLIYASHVLEHVPWYQVPAVVREWVRILAPGGWLEIWVPDGLKICKTLVDAELGGEDATHRDGWYKFNPEKDPCVWASGRIFTYGEGSGDAPSPNWHRALLTPRYLRNVLQEAGLEEVGPMDRSEVRGYDHGWINLGMKGRKSCTTATSPR